MTTTSDTICYREARPDELPSVFALGHEYFAERGMPSDYYDADKMLAFWESLSLTNLATMFAAWEDEACLGGIGVCVRTEEHSRRIVASECAFFIRPSHRGRGIDDALLTMAEIWARALGAETLRVSRFSTTHKGLSVYFAGRGYQVVKVVHEKEL